MRPIDPDLFDAQDPEMWQQPAAAELSRCLACDALVMPDLETAEGLCERCAALVAIIERRLLARERAQFHARARVQAEAEALREASRARLRGY